MPLLKPPSYIPLKGDNGGKYTIPFAFIFTGETPSYVSFAGYTGILAAVYQFSLASVQNSANPSPVKTIQITVEFNGLTPGRADGALYIYVPATGQLVELADSSVSDGSGLQHRVVIAALDLITTEQSVIQFIKGVDTGTTVTGTIFVSLNNFEVQNFALRS